jgi:putative NIF3 family GTP cyclohydrolase 1 type 2
LNLRPYYYILDFMTIQQIYDLAIDMGTKADPRGIGRVKKLISARKKGYEDLPERKKKYFDKETLVNPYSDTRMFASDPQKQIKTILVGIDAGAEEILLADRLIQKGKAIDLVIGHHPEGHGLAGLHDVMDLQIDTWADAGVPANVAHAIMAERMSEVERGIHPLNHNEAVDAARILEIPLLILHTVWDNLGNKFMTEYIKKKKFDTVGEIVDHLMELPEYQEASRGKAGPIIVSGSEKSRCGKIAVFFTGGTNPSKEMYMELAKVGIGTIIDMHVTESALKEVKKLHMNVINAGHMSSDSIGANIFFDELEKKGMEVIPCSGFIRAKRI